MAISDKNIDVYNCDIGQCVLSVADIDNDSNGLPKICATHTRCISAKYSYAGSLNPEYALEYPRILGVLFGYSDLNLHVKEQFSDLISDIVSRSKTYSQRHSLLDKKIEEFYKTHRLNPFRKDLSESILESSRLGLECSTINLSRILEKHTYGSLGNKQDILFISKAFKNELCFDGEFTLSPVCDILYYHKKDCKCKK